LVNVDFATFCMISIPGFLIGLMTGRFVAAPGFTRFKQSLGVFGRLLGVLVFVAYLVTATITVGIMVIYLADVPETAKPASFWMTVFLALWIILNVLLDFRDIFRRRESAKVSTS